MSIYILFYIVFPLLVLLGIRFRKDTKNIFLTKEDSLILKGIAAAMVIISHYTAWTIDQNVSLIGMGIVGQAGGIGVLIFFFVSGYGIYLSSYKKNLKIQFLVRRIRVVYIPYIGMKVFFYILSFLQNPYSKKSLIDFLKIFFPSDWFICVILIQYFLFYFAWKYFREEHQLIILILITIGAAIIYYMVGFNSRWYTSFFSFIVGIFSAKHQEKFIIILRKKYSKYFLITFVTFVIFGGFFVFLKETLYGAVFKIIAGIFLCFAISIAFQKIEINSKCLTWMGKRSLYLYIVHLGAWIFLQEYLKGKPTICVPLAIIMTVLLSELFYRVNKIKLFNSFKLVL